MGASTIMSAGGAGLVDAAAKILRNPIVRKVAVEIFEGLIEYAAEKLGGEPTTLLESLFSSAVGSQFGDLMKKANFDLDSMYEQLLRRFKSAKIKTKVTAKRIDHYERKTRGKFPDASDVQNKNKFENKKIKLESELDQMRLHQVATQMTMSTLAGEATKQLRESHNQTFPEAPESVISKRGSSMKPAQQSWRITKSGRAMF